MDKYIKEEEEGEEEEEEEEELGLIDANRRVKIKRWVVEFGFRSQI